MDEKKCTKCGEVKPLSEFGKHKIGRLGVRSVCKKCNAAEASAYYYQHRGADASARREERKRNSEALALEQREARRLRARTNYWGNPEKHRDYSRQHHRGNPHLAWANQYRLRARRLGQTQVVEGFTKDDVVARYGDACSYCSDGAFDHLDHYIPISSGGTHTLDNVRPSCAACNHSKSDLDPEKWLAKQKAIANLSPNELEAAIDAEIERWT